MKGKSLIKVWECRECEKDTACIRGFDGSLEVHQKNTCNFQKDPVVKPNWQPTEDYEIRKRKGSVPDMPNIPDPPSKKGNKTFDDFWESWTSQGNKPVGSYYEIAKEAWFASRSKNYSIKIRGIMESKYPKQKVIAVYKLEKKGEDMKGNESGETGPPEDIKLDQKIREINKKFEGIKDEIMEFSTKQTPNCAVCRWRIEVDFPYEMPIKILYELCSAQGGRACNNCYSTEQCKALFELATCITTAADISKGPIEYPLDDGVSDILNEAIKTSNISISNLTETFRIISSMSNHGVKFPDYFKDCYKIPAEMILGICGSCKESDAVYLDTGLCQTCDKREK